MERTKQIKTWEGEFGKSYTDRNNIDWKKRIPYFKEMISGLGITRALECGCNKGHNLLAISSILGDSAEIIGIEPNDYAIGLARASSTKISVLKGSLPALPFIDGYFDLTFTAGVLIHIPLCDLDKALREIYRTSGKYILAIEYFAGKETEIKYRDLTDHLWKRDFPGHYQKLFPELKLIRSGFFDKDTTFDRCNWWLMEKQK
jgi:pseudaminic acid biosynthesis-associated methylase